MGVVDSHTYYKAWAGYDEVRLNWHEQEEQAKESYEVETIDWGRHIYVVVWEAAFEQILTCQQEGGNIRNVHNPCAAAVVENYDTLVDNDAPAFNGHFYG